MSKKSVIQVEQLKNLEPLASLSEERLQELVPLVYVEQLAIGGSLFREGDFDNQTVYLLSGEIQLKSSDGSIYRKLSEKSEDIRFPLDDSQPRRTSCSALSRVKLLRIDNSVLDYMMMWDQMAISENNESLEQSEKETQSKQQEQQPVSSKVLAEANNAPAGEQAASTGKETPTAETPKAEARLPAETQNMPEPVATSEQQIRDKSEAVEEQAARPKPVQQAGRPITGQEEKPAVSPGPTPQPAEAKASPAQGQRAEARAEPGQEQKQPEPESETRVVSAVGENATEQEKQSPATTSGSGDRSWIRKMRHIMAFKSMPPANIKKLLECMESIEVKEGETIIRQGEPGDYFYVLTEGEARVTRLIELATIEPGRSFGEEALISEDVRNASVTMNTDGVVMRLSKSDFDELLQEPMLQRLSPGEAKVMVAEGAVWLDVRHAREYHHSHLPHAINIPLHELRIRFDELDKSVMHVCYCSTGKRSSAAAFLLAQKGYKTSVLNGGVKVMAQDLQRNGG